MGDNGIPTKDIADVLDVVSTKLPKLLNDIMKIIYSEDAGKNMGRAVGNLYKELLASGIDKNDALKMTMDYLNLLKNFKLSDFISHEDDD